MVLRIRMLIAILVVAIFLASILAGYYLRVDRIGSAMISWVDCLKLNNTMYYIDHDADVIEPSCVGSSLGYIQFNVAQNVHNPEYHFRNGDATFLVEGTELFRSICNKTDSILVIQDGII